MRQRVRHIDFLQLSVVGIMAIGFVQFGVSAVDGLDLINGKVRVNAAQPALLRGADAAYGGQFAAFVDFMTEQIPQDAAVILIANPQHPEYSDTFFMQYFLFPRFVLICRNDPLESCIDAVGDRVRYVVHTQNVLISGEWTDGAAYYPFNEHMGLWAIER